jgi:hypothetical protein
VDQDAKRIIDIFRGTYLQAKSALRLDQLGQFWLGIEIPSEVRYFATWEVCPLPNRNAIISKYNLGDHIAFWAIDPWDNA